MNKGDLVEKIAAANGISKTAAGGAIDTIVSAVTTALKKGDRVTLVGLRDLLGLATQGAQRAQPADRRRHQDCSPASGQVQSGRRAEEGCQQEIAETLSSSVCNSAAGTGPAALLSADVIRCRVALFHNHRGNLPCTA